MATGFPEIAKSLIDRGANVNALDSDRYTPLHFAANGKTDEHYKVAELLIAAGANVNARSVQNETPLDAAGNPRSTFTDFTNLEIIIQRC